MTTETDRDTTAPAVADSAPTGKPATIGGFDLAALRLSQDFGENLGVKRLLTRVPVRKPLKTEFFRAHPDEAYRFPTMVLELKEQSETYLAAHPAWDCLPDLLRAVVLRTAIDRQNNPFLIPVPQPGVDGRWNSWHQSLHSAVTEAETSWVRCVANPRQGGYDLLVATAKIPDPKWPDLSFEALMQIAFRDRIIGSPDHPVVTQLLGRT